MNEVKKVLTFVDNGFSGGNVNRDGFQKMMRKIEQGKITRVLVYRLDRISRSLADFVNILDTFKTYGVEFVSTQEAFDTSSPYGELIVKNIGCIC
ncbi:MAG: recombinase family protein [Clostridiales bacterium]|nr:MAG: recombinase family protein [Clostridiales bacterium]